MLLQANQAASMPLNASAMLNMAAAPIPTTMASPPGSLPHSSALFHQQASNLSAALQQFQPHLLGRPLEEGMAGAQPGSLPATPQQAQDLLPLFPGSHASVAALMDMSPTELRPTETLPANKQPRQLVIQEFQPGNQHSDMIVTRPSCTFMSSLLILTFQVLYILQGALKPEARSRLCYSCHV